MIGHELIIDEHPRVIMIECGDVATYGVNNATCWKIRHSISSMYRYKTIHV